jgi:hypothetical protein
MAGLIPATHERRHPIDLAPAPGMGRIVFMGRRHEAGDDVYL